MPRPKNNTKEPTDLELQILKVLWENKSATVREVLDNMPDGKERAYTSILSTMQVMEKKELISHHADGKTNVYTAEVARRTVSKPILKRTIDYIFNKVPGKAICQIIGDYELSSDDISEIRAMLDNYEKTGE